MITITLFVCVSNSSCLTSACLLRILQTCPDVTVSSLMTELGFVRVGVSWHPTVVTVQQRSKAA
jgi:hypothetical protein